MKRMIAVLLILVLAAPALAVQSPARADGTPPLLALLAAAPDQPANYANPATAPRFVDYAALYRAEGIDGIRTMNFDALNTLVPLPGILMRIAVAPEALAYVFRTANQMRDTVGFQWIADVDQSLEFGAPPRIGTVLGGTFDADAIGAALSARGFTQTTIADVPVWTRFDDGVTSMADREMSDPFGGTLGLAARIMLLPDGQIANARYTAMAEDMVHAALGDAPSLAQNPAFLALGNAITAPEGELIQAWFLSPEDVALMDMGRLPAGQADPTADYGPLAPYTLAVIADRQEGSDQVHLIGLVYPDAAAAQVAVDEVTARLSRFSPPSMKAAESLLAQYGAQVSGRVVDSPATGNAVAVIEARYPLPANRTDASTGRFISGGLLYRAWANAIMRREFTPLAITG